MFLGRLWSSRLCVLVLVVFAPHLLRLVRDELEVGREVAERDELGVDQVDLHTFDMEELAERFLDLVLRPHGNAFSGAAVCFDHAFPHAFPGVVSGDDVGSVGNEEAAVAVAGLQQLH